MNETAYILHRLNNNESYVIMYWLVHETYLFGDIHQWIYVFIQLLTYVIHLYVSTNYTIIITIVLNLELLTYVIHLYISINYYVHVRKCLLF